MNGFQQNKFFPALILEDIFPYKRRAAWGKILSAAIFFCLLAAAAIFFLRLASNVSVYGGLKTPALNLSGKFTEIELWLGVLYLLLALRLPLLALNSFYNSKTFNKTGEIGNADFYQRLDFFTTQVWFKLYQSGGASLAHLLYALPQTKTGLNFLLRLGISSDSYHKFLNAAVKTEEINENLEAVKSYLEKKSGEEITLPDLATAIFETNRLVHETFITGGLTMETVKETARWVEAEETEADLQRRWWRRERLGRIPGLAKDWAYGHIPHLEKFANDLEYEVNEKARELIGREREIKLVEAALLKRAGANVVIVGEPGSGKRTLLFGLIKMVREGKIFPELEHKRVLELHGPALTAAGKSKGEVEAIFIKILNEAVNAGNIILVLDEFPEFVESLASLGINATEIFSPYLSSNVINLLTMGDTLSYRRILENNAGLMKYFEKIEISEPSQEDLVKILEELVPEVEEAYGRRTTITCPALEKISAGAIQYLVQGALPKRAVDLMEEALKEAVEQNSAFLTAEIVQNTIALKTKLPLGEIKTAEQEKLLNLEDILHQRVVGQEEAIAAIANAIRRARSGLKNPSRPIGTFLFLGPTGVGKTETAKALAEVYFGNEEAMLRFDMTEYQSGEDMEKLIGSLQRNEPGILASKMRSSPYNVVLLDEFEKSHEKIKNLFLQILDEGFFSDYLGQKINMRNTLIIATSNAGAQLIWDMVAKNIDPSTMEHEIVEHIQRKKVMTPELVNRFDAVVVFKPLDTKACLEIARLMLLRLASRLKKQNMILQITDALCVAIAQGGYDPAFGARPMQRFIQDKIEKIISEKIIREEIKPGSEFTLTPDELK